MENSARRSSLKATGAIFFVVLFLIALIAAHAWLWGEWMDTLRWLRDERNANAVQALAALGALGATILLLALTYWQTVSIRRNAAQQVEQADQSALRAWHIADEERRQSEEAASRARRESDRDRKEREEQAIAAVRPFVVWSNPRYTDRERYRLSRVTLDVGNVGAGPAMTVRFWVVRSRFPHGDESGYYAMSPGQWFPIELDIVGPQRPNESPDEPDRDWHPRLLAFETGHLEALLIAAYTDAHGRQYGSRTELFRDTKEKRLRLGPALFTSVSDGDYTIEMVLRDWRDEKGMRWL